MDNICKGKITKNILRIIKGSMFAIFITLILLFIYSLVLTYTNVGEDTINPVIIIISAISIFIASSISTLNIKKHGLINGALIGLIYILSIYLLSSMLGSGFSLELYSIIMIIVCVCLGMFGGIIGVNIK